MGSESTGPQQQPAQAPLAPVGSVGAVGQAPPPAPAAQQQQQQQAMPAPPPGIAPSAAPVFLSFSERKEASPSKGHRRAGGGHSYVVHFTLVDSQGVEHPAVTGTDTGDAHYLYSNEPGMPSFYGHNKADVKAWLEGIIAESQARAGYTGGTVQDPIPEDPAAAERSLPPFLTFKHEKFQLDDGRHIMRWYLVDPQGKDHLAVIGEEKETRDGHYSYRTQGIFDVVSPLECGNQGQVQRWIEAHVMHAPGEAGPAYSGATSGSRPPLPRSGAGGAKRAGGGDLLRLAATNLKRFRNGGSASGQRGLDPDADARDAAAAELRRWAQEEAVRREAAKQQALGYVLDPPLSGQDGASLQRCLAVLRRAAGAAATGGTPPPLPDTLGALREMAHMYAPLAVVGGPGVKQAVAALRNHKCTAVAHLASDLLKQWLRALACHAATLAHPRYATDPRTSLAALLEDQALADRLASGITHRKLRPMPPPYSFPARATPASAGGWSLGEATPLTFPPSATPTMGLSAAPSQQSLPSLLGGVADAEGEAEGGVGSAAAGPSSAAPLFTVERRKLEADLATPRPAGAAQQPKQAGAAAPPPPVSESAFASAPMALDLDEAPSQQLVDLPGWRPSLDASILPDSLP